jgi:hypothetical protein
MFCVVDMIDVHNYSLSPSTPTVFSTDTDMRISVTLMQTLATV